MTDINAVVNYGLLVILAGAMLLFFLPQIVRLYFFLRSYFY